MFLCNQLCKHFIECNWQTQDEGKILLDMPNENKGSTMTTTVQHNSVPM